MLSPLPRTALSAVSVKCSLNLSPDSQPHTPKNGAWKHSSLMLQLISHDLFGMSVVTPGATVR